MTDVAVRRDTARRWLRDNGVYAAIVLLIGYNLIFTDNFATVANLNTQLVQVAPVLIVALGMALVIGTEGVDLSVGSVMAIAAAILPLYLGYGLAPAIGLALVAGALCGLLNGTLVAVVGIQPIVATLALLVGGRGLALVFADGQLKNINNAELLDLGTGKASVPLIPLVAAVLAVVAWALVRHTTVGRTQVATTGRTVRPVLLIVCGIGLLLLAVIALSTGTRINVPFIVLIAAVLAVLVWFLVRQTTFGRQLVSVGGNRAASALAGLPVRRVLMTTYVISGMLAAIAGIIATARLTASDPSRIGELFELSAITAVVVGGTPLSGGRVRVLGTVAGALLMQLIAATLIKHNLPPSTAQIVQAAIIVAAVYLQRSRSGGGQ